MGIGLSLVILSEFQVFCIYLFLWPPVHSPSYLVCFAVGAFIEVDDGEVDNKPIKVWTNFVGFFFVY